MATKSALALLKSFKKKDMAELQFESGFQELSGCLIHDSQEPENSSPAQFSANDIIVVGKHFDKKKLLPHAKKDSKKEEKKQKVYRKGPLAKFYILNESTLDKDAPVWYYKEGKQILGPISCYNMDKMVYFKTITNETRIAYKNIEKFVKFEKILKIVEENYKEEESDGEEA